VHDSVIVKTVVKDARKCWQRWEEDVAGAVRQNPVY